MVEMGDSQFHRILIQMFIGIIGAIMFAANALQFPYTPMILWGISIILVGIAFEGIYEYITYPDLLSGSTGT